MLYIEISKGSFELLSQNPGGYQEEMCIQSIDLTTSMEGIRFLLQRVAPQKDSELIDEIFYPNTTIGHYVDPALIDPENIELLESMVFGGSYHFYHSSEKVHSIDNFLSSINREDLQQRYIANELNSLGIYPEVWHDDESENRVFNRRDIMEGFDDLRSVFQAANGRGNVLLVFAE